MEEPEAGEILTMIVLLIFVGLVFYLLLRAVIRRVAAIVKKIRLAGDITEAATTPSEIHNTPIVPK